MNKKQYVHQFLSRDLQNAASAARVNGEVVAVTLREGKKRACELFDSDSSEGQWLALADCHMLESYCRKQERPLERLKRLCASRRKMGLYVWRLTQDG